MAGGNRQGRRARRGWLIAAVLVACSAGIGATAPAAFADTLEASFTATPNPVVVGGTVTFSARGEVFTNLRSPGPDDIGIFDGIGTNATFEWDLDNDGQFDDATGISVSKQFPTLGTFRIALRVTDEGLSDETEHDILVTTTPPDAVLTAAPDGPSSLDTVTFDASGSTDPDDPIASYEWDLDGTGFGVPTSSDTMARAFDVPGARLVRVRVTDQSGASDTASVVIDVANLAPSAALAAPTVAEAGTDVTLDASGSDDLDGTIDHYLWDYDGNGIFDAQTSGSSVVHRFAGNGTYNVKVKVVDDWGAVDTTSLAITVTGAPTALLDILTDPATAGSPVSFDASSSYDDDGTVARYDWDLDGNGTYETTTGASPTATRTYANPGTVVVHLRVVDDQGGQGTTAETLTIRAPSASAGGSDDTGVDDPDASDSGDDGSVDVEATADAMVASLSGTVIQKLRDVIAKGLAFGCTTDRRARCELVVSLGGRKPVTIGRVVVSLKRAGGKTLKVKLSAKGKRLLRRMRSAQIVVRGTATDADGNTTDLKRTFLLRR